ncbi:hypothetical protein BS78_03G058800 [Paspalum vaginatum]|nr:hypothetical protein BS78_03G058800 [Paspalum vaginatum]
MGRRRKELGERTAATDGWREFADLVPRSLLPYVDGTRFARFNLLVNGAYRKVATSIYISRRAQAGATEHELAAIPRPPPDGHTTIDLVELARQELGYLGRKHVLPGQGFLVYLTRTGGVQQGHRPLWMTFGFHYATALRRVDEAMESLHHAAAFCEASMDAYRVSMTFPGSSPGWAAWTSAAEELSRGAASALTTAALLVRRMRHEVRAEYVTACILLAP